MITSQEKARLRRKYDNRKSRQFRNLKSEKRQTKKKKKEKKNNWKKKRNAARM